MTMRTGKQRQQASVPAWLAPAVIVSSSFALGACTLKPASLPPGRLVLVAPAASGVPAWAASSFAALQPVPAPVVRVAPPAPESPFADSPVSFLVRGPFSRGELVIVRVCLRPDHSIASSAILESSGDPHFDAQAIEWARLVKLRSAVSPGTRVAACGSVRVELHNASEPPLGRPAGNLLG